MAHCTVAAQDGATKSSPFDLFSRLEDAAAVENLCQKLYGATIT